MRFLKSLDTSTKPLDHVTHRSVFYGQAEKGSMATHAQVTLSYGEEVSKIQNKAHNVQAYADPAGANAVMMWAVVQVHEKHREFKVHRF
jgi:hypothetical protein